MIPIALSSPPETTQVTNLDPNLPSNECLVATIFGYDACILAGIKARHTPCHTSAHNTTAHVTVLYACRSIRLYVARFTPIVLRDTDAYVARFTPLVLRDMDTCVEGTSHARQGLTKLPAALLLLKRRSLCHYQQQQQSQRQDIQRVKRLVGPFAGRGLTQNTHVCLAHNRMCAREGQ